MEQISVRSGTSFLELFFKLVPAWSHPCHTAAFWLFSLITLYFLLYSYFHHFGLKHCSLKPSWLVVLCGTRSASAKEMHMHLIKVTPCAYFGFPKTCVWLKNCVYPRQAYTQMVEHVSKGNPHTTHCIRQVMHGDQLQHMSAHLCKHFVCMHDLKKPKLYSIGFLLSSEFGGQVQVQFHFCSTHINPWKQGFFGTETTLWEN